MISIVKLVAKIKINLEKKQFSSSNAAETIMVSFHKPISPFSFQLEIFTQCMPPDDMYFDEDYGGGFL